MSVQTYNLNLEPGLGNVVVHCSQYDKDYRIVQFTMFNGDAIYPIPDYCTVLVRGTKKDNMGFEYECEYQGSTVTFPIKDQMTVYSGKYSAEIRIVRDNKLIGSANFVFNVEASPLTDDTIISETQLPLLEQALEAASEAEQYKIDAHVSELNAQAWAEGKKGDEPVTSDDPQYENNAKYYSEQAHASEENAHTSEINAHASETNASDSADVASQKAQTATDKADIATLKAQNASDSADVAVQKAGEAGGYAESASENALKAEGFAVGKQNDVVVGNTSPYWHNNAEYFADRAEQAMNVSGYMEFHIDENGQLIYTRTATIDTDFYINNDGELVLEVIL